MGHPTRPTQPSIPLDSIMSSNTWITRVETIKMVDYGYMWLYGCRQKSVSLGLSCGLDWTMSHFCKAQHRLGAIRGTILVHLNSTFCYLLTYCLSREDQFRIKHTTRSAYRMTPLLHTSAMRPSYFSPWIAQKNGYKTPRITLHSKIYSASQKNCTRKVGKNSCVRS